MITRSPRIVVIGAVHSTLRILQGLVRNGAQVVGVFSLDPGAGTQVSGLASLEIAEFARLSSIPHRHFVKINDPDIVHAVREMNPDLLFPVGFSQLVGSELLSIPSLGAVGFHPTHLPKGRGRAPLAWLTYAREDGASTFFVMGEGADDGPILAQEPFHVDPDDHATDVEVKILAAIDVALDNWVPRFLRGEWHPIPQDDSKASFTGIRRPPDGLIPWDAPFDHVYGLIRSASDPHPGAYTYLQGTKVIVWRAKPETKTAWRGVPGRVLWLCPERGALVQAGEGLLWLSRVEDAADPSRPVVLRVGMKLGYAAEDELFEMKQQLATMQARLEVLERKNPE